MIRLLQGDCIEMMKTLPDKSVDAIITDPPYGTTACKWDTVIPLEPMWEQLKRIIKPNGAIVLFGSEPFSSALRMSNIKNYKYDWIWEKEQGSNYATVKYMPFKVTENISIFASNKCTYNPQMEKGKPYKDNARTRNLEHSTKNTIKKEIINLGTRYPRNKLYFQNDTKKGFSLHPTQKPVALLEYLIKTYTNEGETVLDFTAGSGTLGVSAINTNRNAILIERDAEYFKIIEKRISEAEQSKKNNLFAGE
jgi:DNA modification methylase